MAVITETAAVVDAVRITHREAGDNGTGVIVPAGNRLIIECHTVDASGTTVRRFFADVTDQLTTTQQQQVDTIYNRAQQWATAQL